MWQDDKSQDSAHWIIITYLLSQRNQHKCASCLPYSFTGFCKCNSVSLIVGFTQNLFKWAFAYLCQIISSIFHCVSILKCWKIGRISVYNSKKEKKITCIQQWRKWITKCLQFIKKYFIVRILKFSKCFLSR